jgi:cytochrome c oxidase subunit 4
MSTPHAHAAVEPSSLAGHSSDHGHSDGDFAHPLPVWILLSVFAVLTILTVITVAQASFDLGHFDVLVTMVIATIKATLVMLFFMHLAFDKPFNLIIFLSSFVFVALFIIFTLSDSSMNSFAFEPVVDEPVTATAAP